MTPRILFLTTFYPEFLTALYRSEPDLPEQVYKKQLERVVDTGFGVCDAYAAAMRKCGWEAEQVICNADELQRRWALENDIATSGNIHDVRRQVVAGQVKLMRPDVLFVFEWSPLGDAFLQEMQHQVGLLVGQIASPLRDERTYAAYDLMLSSWPPIVEYIRGEGRDAEPFRLGFDPRVLERIDGQAPKYDVSFVGGFAPSHPNRVEWLEALLSELDIDVFGYGVERVPVGSSIRAHHHGEVWGWSMYETLQQSRVTLNLHAVNDVRGTSATNVANNLRLYEATGVGTCLLTEAKENLAELFEPDREVMTYSSIPDCIERVGYLLEHDSVRAQIAQAGQRRTLREHTWEYRMRELIAILEPRMTGLRHHATCLGAS